MEVCVCLTFSMHVGGCSCSIAIYIYCVDIFFHFIFLFYSQFYFICFSLPRSMFAFTFRRAQVSSFKGRGHYTSTQLCMYASRISCTYVRTLIYICTHKIQSLTLYTNPMRCLGILFFSFLFLEWGSKLVPRFQ